MVSRNADLQNPVFRCADPILKVLQRTPEISVCIGIYNSLSLSFYSRARTLPRSYLFLPLRLSLLSSVVGGFVLRRDRHPCQRLSCSAPLPRMSSSDLDFFVIPRVKQGGFVLKRDEHPRQRLESPECAAPEDVVCPRICIHPVFGSNVAAAAMRRPQR